MQFTPPMTNVRRVFIIAAIVLLAAVWAPTATPETDTASGAKQAQSGAAPLPPAEKAAATHAPFDADDCSTCHKNADRKNPGPLTDSVNKICLGCHEDVQKALSRKHTHAAATDSCINCHNPHNSRQPKLLMAESGSLCVNCHGDIGDVALKSKSGHGAVTQGAKCLSCHDPHGADIEHLLVRPATQLCLNCHGKDGIVDSAGKTLANMKKLLEENPNHHGPVADKDCGACHNPHGSKTFRLLKDSYPETFYAPYDPKQYALCFGCHDEKMAREAETTSQTQFRDGSRNLHYLHVNKPDRGRTCRACHEVHASKREHQIRDGVAFGSGGWTLSINYTKTPTGGSCAKTCHSAKSYTNSVAKPTQAAAGS